MLITDICSVFNITRSQIISVNPYGSGHIHDTYKVETKESTDYLLQKINSEIFTDVPLMQKNIEEVVRHLKKNIRAGELVPEILKTKEKQSYYHDDEGNYWRMFVFIPGSITYDRVHSAGMAFEAGKAYGHFQFMLSDFDTSSLTETLPRFHDVDHRMEQFEESVKSDPRHRTQHVTEEIDFVRSRIDRMRNILKLGENGKIPLRVTHNDTKVNNVLFNEQDKAVCVIDLDTVMPGYIHYDFGDAIRTGAASADEDEPDLQKMFINIELFEAYSRGFLGQVHNLLNKMERETLAFAPQLMTFIIGLRFLTDYMNGDTYFKIKSQEHNLIRWKAQKKLLLSMEAREEEMNAIITNIEKEIA